MLAISPLHQVQPFALLRDVRTGVFGCGLAILLAACVAQSAGAQSEATAESMLEALKERGYYELADHYLERLAASDTISGKWKRQIPFHRAGVLIELVGNSDSDDVDQRIAEARKLLKQFIEDNPGDERIGLAEFESARLRMVEGYRAVAEADKTEDEAEKKSLLKSAGTAFRSAESQFRKRKNVLSERLKNVQESVAAQSDQGALDKLRSDLLFARMTIATLEFEQAKLLKDNGDDAKYSKQIQAALKEFENISKEFRERRAGLEAVLFQGLCYEHRGDTETALDYYEQLLQLGEIPQDLMTRTVARLLACYVRIERPEKAVTIGQKWLARGGERQSDAEAAEVRVNLAEAHMELAKTESGRKQDRQYADARKQLTSATKISGPHQVRARTMLATLPASAVVTTTPDALSGDSDFATAMAAAQQSRDAMQSTAALVQLRRRKLETAKDVQRRGEAEAELKAVEQDLQRFQLAAMNGYRQALAKADDATPIDDVNKARYMIAFLNYQMQRYFEAAAIAEFVAERFPQASHAKDCANIAMACYWKLYQQDPSDSGFANDRMINVAQLIADRWPGSPEAVGALVNLVNLTVAEGHAAKAESYLNRIPAESPARLAAELRTGTGLWRLWKRETRADRQVDPDLLSRAQAMLESGLNRARGKQLDAAVAQAALALAELQTETDHADQALELLRDPEIGPKTIVDKQLDAAKSPGFIESTYRALLNAMIGQLAAGKADADTTMREARITMDALQKAVGESAEGQRRATSMYVALAQDLRQQIESAPEDQKNQLRGGFIAFLDRVAERSTTINTRLWVAETYMAVADDLVSDSGSVPAEAQQFYDSAATTLAALMELPDGQDGMTPELRTQVRLQAALSLRRIGKHEKAIALFEDVLRDRPAVINVQVEAAKTYQDAGATGSSNLYELAIRGARPDGNGKNVIWGWERIAKVMAGQMQKGPEEETRFGDIFFEARYNVALCRYLQSQSAQGAAQDKFLKQAQRAIQLTRTLYPELGGEAWKAKFIELGNRVRGK